MSRNYEVKPVIDIHTTALPGRGRERGGLSGLVRLDTPAITTGMVVVAKIGEPWRTQPELWWQVWPDLLELDNLDE